MDARRLRQRHPKDQILMEDLMDPDAVRTIRDAQDDGAFPLVDLDIETAYRCPACGYEWSGNPKPSGAEAEDETEP
jgi:rubrerythrin